MSRRDFDRALVTGASAGIGRELALQLGADGTDVVAVARSTDRLGTLAERLRDAHSVGAEVLPADLTTDEGIRAVEARLADGPAVDLLVNNAGMSQLGSFAETDAGRAAAQVTLNAEAVMRLTHAAVGRMQAGDGGAVLMTSSTASFQPMPRMAVYGASKAFVTHLGQALHEELRGTGVTVTVLCPGFTRTAFLGDQADRIPPALLSEPEAVARAGLRAARRGQAVVTPGAANKAHRAVASTSPSAVLRRLAGRVP